MKKPGLLAGTQQSLVVIWTNTPAGNCASYLLVGVPMLKGGGAAQIARGFGTCNPEIQQVRMKHGNWEFWSLIAFREDSPKVGVAVSREGKFTITVP